MRLFGRKAAPIEKRADLTVAVTAQLDAAAAVQAADAGGTAGIEAASGQLGRAFAGATVKAPEWAQAALTPAFLGQLGRDLIRYGGSLWRIEMRGGRLGLYQQGQWSWIVGRNADASTWVVQCTEFGPGGSETRRLTAAEVVWQPWAVSPSTPHLGRSPAQWARLTAKLAAEAERSLGDEAGGPIAQIVPLPQDEDGDPDDADDAAAQLTQLRADVSGARGAAIFPETTAAGWGEGAAGAPQTDWKGKRLGPQPPQPFVEVARDAFSRILAACGTNVAMFGDADGTSKREALRAWHQGTVLPIARILEHELTAKLETEVRLEFDSYPRDLAGRAAAFRQLVSQGVEVERALAITGLLIEGSD